jgi:GT2 family glycosyltransferase
VIIFSDAHVEVPPNWIAPLLEPLTRSKVGAVAPAINDLRRRGKGMCGARWSRIGNGTFRWQWLGRQGSIPYPVPLLCGCFIATRRDVFEATCGFDPGLIMYGMEDVEFCIRLWTLGYKCLVVPNLVVTHRFGVPDRALPSDYKFNSEINLHNRLRMAVIHFGSSRLQHLFQGQAPHSAFPAAFARLVASDAWSRRNEIHAIRRHDEDWFFRKFNMDQI